MTTTRDASVARADFDPELAKLAEINDTTSIDSSACLDKHEQRRMLGEQYRGLVPRLRRIVAGSLRRLNRFDLTADELDELVQEAFCRVLRSIDVSDYDARRDLLPYLTAICFHVAADRSRARKKSRARAVTLHFALNDELYVEPPDANLDSPRRMLPLIAAWLAEQEPAIQMLFHRRFWMDESQRVAAQTLRLSRHEVRTLEQRMRLSLLRYLKFSGTELAPLDS